MNDPNPWIIPWLSPQVWPALFHVGASAAASLMMLDHTRPRGASCPSRPPSCPCPTTPNLRASCGWTCEVVSGHSCPRIHLKIEMWHTQVPGLTVDHAYVSLELEAVWQIIPNAFLAGNNDRTSIQHFFPPPSAVDSSVMPQSGRAGHQHCTVLAYPGLEAP